jgi:zinc transport system substrate-binding protein
MRISLLLIAFLVPVWSAAQPLKVFVSVLPQKTFVEKIGGDHVEVRAMVGPGHNPATYDPTPQQISALAKTPLYIRIGVPFEEAWMERIRSANPRMQVLDARAGLDLPTLEGGTEHDPHVWTSPPLVKHMAKNIRDALIGLDPVNSDAYTRNYAAYAAELDDLDRDIRALLADLTQRKFMVFHPAWSYFAGTYGLTQIAIEHEGKTPGARTLTQLIDQARREDIEIIFVQPQFGEKSAKRVAAAVGAQVVTIDPLAPDYASNIRTVARLIAQAARP